MQSPSEHMASKSPTKDQFYDETARSQYAWSTVKEEEQEMNYLHVAGLGSLQLTLAEEREASWGARDSQLQFQHLVRGPMGQLGGRSSRQLEERGGVQEEIRTKWLRIYLLKSWSQRDLCSNPVPCLTVTPNKSLSFSSSHL